MSIQSNINQAMSLAGLLYSQSPAAALAKEQKVAKVKTQRLMEAYERQSVTGAEKEPYELQTIAEVEPHLRVAELGVEAHRAAFELEPSEETHRAYVMATRTREGYTNRIKEIEQEEREAAQQEQQEAQEETRAESARVAEARARAREAIAAEQERLARSRQFAEMVTAGVTPEYGRREGGR